MSTPAAAVGITDQRGIRAVRRLLSSTGRCVAMIVPTEFMR